MREIFVGSSTEALHQAEQVAALLGEVPEVRPILWRDVFSVGDITFIAIEGIAKRAVGAVFLATPDDASMIRDRAVRIPRANVLFEYGYLTARLARSRVALCRYDDTELPSDFAGLTVVAMGKFLAHSPDTPLDAGARVKLRSWATQLPALPVLPENVEDEFRFPPPYDKKNQPLADAALAEARKRISEWKPQARAGKAGTEGVRVGLVRTYTFVSFEDAMHFMQTASRCFSRAEHHPEWENVWVHVRVWLTSWDIGHRPSLKDVGLAEQLDKLYEDYA
jgi:pterin-4a-carbinolamine dehydratase